jgi:histidine triad (HIT) family protein
VDNSDLDNSDLWTTAGPPAARPKIIPVDQDCLFCRIVAGDIPATVVHETDTTLAFRDINPLAPVHVLVIPKEHHPDLIALTGAAPGLAAEVLAATAEVARIEDLTTDGFRVSFNNGGFAGQEVFHVHAHVLGGRPLGRSVSA